MQSNLHERLLQHVMDTHLFAEPGRALVAVSGGADSVALVLLLHRLARTLGLDIAVAHVNHGIHPESKAVAERVMHLASQMDLPVLSEDLALGAAASETKARVARYRALWQMQQKLGCRYLVTAHHADDQVETILLRFLRGSGMSGLAGIPATGPSGVVRPLLAFRKTEIAEWLEGDEFAKTLAPDIHQDPSNADHGHDRSWIRHVVLPMVKSRFEYPVDEAILDVAANAGEDRAAWSALLRELPALRFRATSDVVQVARETLPRYDPRLSQALLRAAALEIGCVLGPRRARRIWPLICSAASGRTFELGHGWVLETVFQDVRIRRLDEVGPDDVETSGEWGHSDTGEVRWGDWLISWRPEVAEAVTRSSLVTWTTPGRGAIRVPKPGDRIRPVRGVGSRKVSRLLMEGKVPWPERSSYPVLTRGEDILWLPGICRSDSDVPETGKKAVRIHARCN